MSDGLSSMVTGQLVAVVKEAFEGAGHGSYFTDHGAEAGWFGTLAKLSAAEASRPVGGTSIAAHVHHMIFSLEASTAWVSGDQSPRNWADSWRVSEVDETGWARMRTEIRAGYENLCRALDGGATSSADACGGAVGAVAHVAYHLGAVRQKAKQLKAEG